MLQASPPFCLALRVSTKNYFEDKQRWQVLSTRAQEKVEQEFTLEKQALFVSL